MDTLPSSLTTTLQLPATLAIPIMLPAVALSYCDDEFRLDTEHVYGLPGDGVSGFLPTLELAVKAWLANPAPSVAAGQLLVRHLPGYESWSEEQQPRIDALRSLQLELAHPNLIWALLQEPGQLVLRLCHALFGIHNIGGTQVLLAKRYPGPNEEGVRYVFRASKGMDDLSWHHEIQTVQCNHGSPYGALSWEQK